MAGTARKKRAFKKTMGIFGRAEFRGGEWGKESKGRRARKENQRRVK